MITHMETKRDMSYIARNARIILDNMTLAKQGAPATGFKPLKYPQARRRTRRAPKPAQKKTSPKNKIQTELPI